MRDVRLTFSTDGDGAATASHVPEFAKLYAVEWLDGDLANGVDATVTITNRATGVDRTVLTLTNADNDAFYHVGAGVYDAAGGTIAGSYVPVIVDGTLTVTVANGGSAKAGGIRFYLG
jgi:hypothetical protein